MPDYEPVSGDPFAPQFTPVSGDPFDPLAASAGIAPAGPTPVGTAMLKHAIDLAAAPGRVAAGQQPQQPGYWSDLDEARAQANARGLQVGAPEAALTMVGAPGLGGGVPGMGSGIRAFHGSPHDFERFDMSKIGTGEGAQAYGHGLYFAENPDTAQYYKKFLEPTKMFHGDEVLSGPAENAANILQDRGGDKWKAQKFIQSLYFSPTADRKWLDATAAEIDRLDPGKIEQRTLPGKTYEVNIAADPEHFLDWDKPLSEQHPKVQEALAGFGVKGDATDLGEFAGQNVRGAPRTGAEIYETLSGRVPGDLLSARGDRPGMSQALREAGIPGIKYLDQGSRGAGTGTSNYVVFDDKLIDIIKKYGLAGLIGGGAAHFKTSPVSHDPFADTSANNGT
jgi:hypothetical protein